MLSRTCLAYVVAGLVSVGHAWLPHDGSKILVDRDGVNMFNLSSRYVRENNGVIRGVNLGNLFVYEPWMDSGYWTNTMGCVDAGYPSEFDCTKKLGQATANDRFKAHWDSYITPHDFDLMKQYSLNTVRIPIGYWMLDSIIYNDSEYFPRGGFEYLRKVCGWASDRGFYIILEYVFDKSSSRRPASMLTSHCSLHGAPAAQTANNAFTGQVRTWS
jgi:hypothetical protein